MVPKVPRWPVEDVLADVLVLKGLEDEITQAGLFEAPGVRFVQSIDETMTISPEDWSVLVSLVQPFTFGQLEARLGYGGAVRVFHSLHRLGVAEATNGDNNGNWLDRLTDAVTPESARPTWVEDTPDEELKEEPVEPESVAAASESEDTAAEPKDPTPKPGVRGTADVQGVSAPATTTLTDGVYDEIRRLCSKVAEK